MAMTLDEIFSGPMSYNQRRALRELLVQLVESGGGGGGGGTDPEDHQAILDLIARVDALESGDVLDDETVASIATRLATAETDIDGLQTLAGTLDDRLDTAEASITANALAINARASASGLIQLSGATQAGLDARYTKTAVDAIVAAAGGKIAAYSASKTYKSGDVAVSPSGDLVQAAVDIDPSAAPLVVGTSGITGTGSTVNLPLPPGSAVGDRLLVLSNDNANPPAPLMLLGQISGTAYGYLYTATLDSATVLAGSVAVTAATGIRVSAVALRNVSTPVLSSSQAVVVAGGGAVASPTQTAANGDLIVRAATFWDSNNGTMTSDPSIAAPATADLVYRSGRFAQLIAHFTATGNVAANVATIAAPGLGTSMGVARFEVRAPVASGYNASQWTKLVDTSSLKPKRVAVANVDYAADGTESVIAYTSLTANRTVTLPPSTSVTPGRVLKIQRNAAANAFGVSVAPASGDTLQGSTGTIGPLFVSTSGTLRDLIAVPGGWVFGSDAVLDSKLDNTPGAVGLTNLADAAKPTLVLASGSYGDGGTISAAVSQANVNLPTAAGTITLPSVASLLAGTHLLVRSRLNTSEGLPLYPLTVNRNSATSDTIGASGATSLVIPPSIGFALLRANGAGRWDIIAGAGAPETATRATATKATASLAANASETGTVTIAKSARLMRAATDRPARVRLYATAAQAAADASRAIGTDPTGDHGLLLELVTTSLALSKTLTPQVDISNMETTPTTAISYVITNMDSSAASVTVTLTAIPTEA